MGNWDDIYRQEAMQRQADARHLLNDNTFITVDLPYDPDWPPDAGDVVVSFDDVASHGLSDLVDETVAWLVSRPGIRDAVREDRELICVWGDVDRAQLRAELLAWWKDQLTQIVATP